MVISTNLGNISSYFMKIKERAKEYLVVFSLLLIWNKQQQEIYWNSAYKYLLYFRTHK